MDFQRENDVQFETIPKSELVLAKNLKIMSKVSTGKYYSVKLQLGPRTGFGSLGNSNDIQVLPKKNPLDTSVIVEATPSGYRLDRVAGREVNGLIQASNDWIQQNQLREGSRDKGNAGRIGRMIAVTEVTETENKPESFNAMAGVFPMEMLRSMVQEEARKIAAEMIAASGSSGGGKKQAAAF